MLPEVIRRKIKLVLEMDVADVASLPALARLLSSLIRFIYRASVHFVEDKCIQRASALAFATLLAIVPFVVLGFAMLANFNALESLGDTILRSMADALMPSSSKAIEKYLTGVAHRSTALSVFGILGLLFTATALLNTMEEAFNDIWGITRARSWLAKFIIFWALLTLTPLLIAASLSIGSNVSGLPGVENVAAGAKALQETPFLLPWLISSLALAALYTLLPNTSVPIRFALIGGLFSGALFELTKFGFHFYVTQLANYEKTYGALATLPLFLIWLYLVWVVVLIGAEIVFCLQHPEQSQKQRKQYDREGIAQFFAHLILLRSAEAQHCGRMLTLQELSAETGIASNLMQEWLDRLCRLDLLRQVG